ncbi:hypothetical protein Mgra_00006392 [Meloidogyne graminicola]|uniref:Uncharacterized protein n=1 Tax=Meloidogyne graminicola TaxID=189291 RepID=A0A8S9ZLQ0_9BILA|nr:hypothetical protein Mgra_00006392 [Meloidogyne graminicola]
MATNQSTTKNISNNNSLCSSSLFTLPTSAIKNSIIIDNLNNKRYERFYVFRINLKIFGIDVLTILNILKNILLLIIIMI